MEEYTNLKDDLREGKFKKVYEQYKNGIQKKIDKDKMDKKIVVLWPLYVTRVVKRQEEKQV